jgi:hypothetical protein
MGSDFKEEDNLRKKICKEQINRYSRLRGIGSSGQDCWRVGVAKSLP